MGPRARKGRRALRLAGPPPLARRPANPLPTAHSTLSCLGLAVLRQLPQGKRGLPPNAGRGVAQAGSHNGQGVGQAGPQAIGAALHHHQQGHAAGPADAGVRRGGGRGCKLERRRQHQPEKRG